MLNITRCKWVLVVLMTVAAGGETFKMILETAEKMLHSEWLQETFRNLLPYFQTSTPKKCHFHGLFWKRVHARGIFWLMFMTFGGFWEIRQIETGTRWDSWLLKRKKVTCPILQRKDTLAFFWEHSPIDRLSDIFLAWLNSTWDFLFIVLQWWFGEEAIGFQHPMYPF